MFRKIACILSALGMVFCLCVTVQAAAADLPFSAACIENVGKWVPSAALQKEPPNTGDYPAPIFTAMLISMAIVVLLVMTENRRK